MKDARVFLVVAGGRGDGVGYLGKNLFCKGQFGVKLTI